VDLVHLRKVSANGANFLANEWYCLYAETLAKTRQKIEVYAMLMRQIRDKKSQQEVARIKDLVVLFFK
jgi:hypothetical protein